jgi:hypothetical protein
MAHVLSAEQGRGKLARKADHAFDSGAGQARDLLVASRARGALQRIQFGQAQIDTGFHGCSFHVSEDNAWGAEGQTMNSHVSLEQNSSVICCRSVT